MLLSLRRGLYILVDVLTETFKIIEYQRFDDTLRARVQSLQDQIDKTTMTVTQMRRTVPKQTADRLRAQMEQQIEQDLISLPSLATLEAKSTSKKNDWESLQNLPRQEEVEKNWENLMIKLGELRDVCFGLLCLP